MLEVIPSREQIAAQLGEASMNVWKELNRFIEANYDFEPFWKEGGKYGTWEFKYRKSGKTLCTFYVKDGYFTLLIVYGKAEREKFELEQSTFSSAICRLYKDIPQYHDGKWLWIDMHDLSNVQDVERLISIKKKPKHK